jgi:periplasmic protein TonB
MGYTALLFCPEEKTARTVTQVLSELEFTIEACSEPFAAVKKLMGQHFDAVVVDCDNEQNATLLFKSARNSASNQTSLAVAVVEGQAGVAKAFRIGANLVLTKPINIEQAKGTLRVARGLLRKSEPAKGGIAPSTPAASPAKAAAPKPVSEPARTAEEKPTGVFAAQAAEPLEVKPTPAWTADDKASTKTASDDDLLDIEDKPEAKPAVTVPPNPDAPILPSEIFAARGDARSIFAGTPTTPTSGAASAPAPAREVKEIAAPKERRASDSDDDVLESGAGTAGPGSIVGSAPSFTFGGTNFEAESSGGSKRIVFGIAAAAIVATGLYFGWSHFHGSAEQPSSPQASVSTEAAISQPVKSSAHPAATKPSPAAASSAPISESTPGKDLSRQSAAEEDGGSAPQPTKSVSTAVKSDAEETVEPAPLMVKGGKVPAKHTKAAADAPAPSLIGMNSGEAVPPPNFAATDATFKPTLQTLNVSQGVSQGLLIKKVPPSYPPSALRMRIEGDVELVATIAKTGEITHVKVLSGDSQLTKAATDAVKQWKYKPYLLNGEPVEIQTQVTVRFKLPQ